MSTGPRDATTVSAVRILWACGRLSMRSIAELLGLSEMAVRRMVHSGRPGAPKSLLTPSYAAMLWPKEALRLLETKDKVAPKPSGNRGGGLDMQAVVVIRERAAAGESMRALALAFGCSCSTIVRIVNRQTKAYVAATPTEADLLAERGLAKMQEAEHAMQMTGRVIGPDGHVYPHIRAAEVASGMERMAMARELARGTRWRYELGTAPAPDPAAYDDAPEWRSRDSTRIARHR